MLILNVTGFEWDSPRIIKQTTTGFLFCQYPIKTQPFFATHPKAAKFKGLMGIHVLWAQKSNAIEFPTSTPMLNQSPIASTSPCAWCIHLPQLLQGSSSIEHSDAQCMELVHLQKVREAKRLAGCSVKVPVTVDNAINSKCTLSEPFSLSPTKHKKRPAG